MYTQNEVSNPIDEKIELLHDFCILRRNANQQEEDVRKILSTCKSQYELDRKVRGLLMGEQTIKEFIKTYGVN